MRGVIRSRETIQLDATGQSLEEARANVIAKLPQGFELTDALPQMLKGSAGITIAGKARSTQTQEIEAGSLDAMHAATPEGWQLQFVLPV